MGFINYSPRSFTLRETAPPGYVHRAGVLPCRTTPTTGTTSSTPMSNTPWRTRTRSPCSSRPHWELECAWFDIEGIDYAFVDITVWSCPLNFNPTATTPRNTFAQTCTGGVTGAEFEMSTSGSSLRKNRNEYAGTVFYQETSSRWPIRDLQFPAIDLYAYARLLRIGAVHRHRRDSEHLDLFDRHSRLGSGADQLSGGLRVLLPAACHGSRECRQSRKQMAPATESAPTVAEESPARGTSRNSRRDDGASSRKHADPGDRRQSGRKLRERRHDRATSGRRYRDPAAESAYLPDWLRRLRAGRRSGGRLRRRDRSAGCDRERRCQ